VKEKKLTRRTHVMRIYVAQGRPGVLLMKYKHSTARRNPRNVNIVNGTSAIVAYGKEEEGVDVDGKRNDEPLRLELEGYKGTAEERRKEEDMDKENCCRGGNKSGEAIIFCYLRNGYRACDGRRRDIA
jgi:hypothetical protein